jgi:hypothetical protein
MNVLLISRRERHRIAELIKRARRRPIPLSLIIKGDPGPTPTLMLKDRVPGIERPPSEHIMLGTHRIAFSFEHQPIGLCRHLSVSVPMPGRAPLPEVVAIIAKEFGFSEFPPSLGRVWLEEFEPGHMAVNVVELVEPSTQGHA